MILLAVLTACVSCKTPSQPESPRDEVLPIITGLIPELPELPDWPDLDWQYIDGWYCVSEADADRILDYWENQIPSYLYQLELYQKKLAVIVTAI